jgi:stage IV sporulation protein A
MEGFDVYADIARRTGGEVYLGVVGPVRTGKSTFVKRFMELLVLPNITDPYVRERAVDELPQSGAGRTVMTTEPKFVPDQGIEVALGEGLSVRVRLVDSVGFPVPGALGYEEDGTPRMVVTPWFDYEIPFEEAAEVGTRKVITDHATIGVVVTTDGSFGELARESFVAAERRAVSEIANLGKPFVVLLNTARPDSPDARALADSLRGEYGVAVLPVSVAAMTEEDLRRILREVLYEFPVREASVRVAAWVKELDPGHGLRRRLEEAAAAAAEAIKRVRDAEAAVRRLGENDVVGRVDLTRVDLGTGVVEIDLDAPDAAYYAVLREISGVDLSERAALVRLLRELVAAKREYDRVAEALAEVRQMGYGVVVPDLADMTFEEPELVRRGNQFGVRLRAKAPSLHLIRADVEAEYTPILGTERQSEDLVNYLMEKFEDDPSKIWESQIFGRSLHDLLREGIRGKLARMPEAAQQKLQETLQRIVNEGSGGLICIIL